MKKITLWVLRMGMAVLLLWCMAVATWAVPARQGIRRTISLADGTQVEVTLTGDEHTHCWKADDGTLYVQQDDGFRPVTADRLMMSRARKRQSQARARQTTQNTSLPRKNSATTGDKKGIIILVNFADTNFLPQHDRALYHRIANEQGFTSPDGFEGSVHDYFFDQSYGLLNLSFDVMGPVTMPHGYAYYGKDRPSDGYDIRPDEMVVEACKAVDGLVNFADYDWNGDGMVNQVVIIYAGRGQATGGGSDTIWPHEDCLTACDYGRVLTLDGVGINTYAVCNEMATSSRIDGIGTLCHEFAHCLGLIDAYDTRNGGHFGMGDWTLMGSGNYCNHGFTPSGLSGFERMRCGWLTPVELTTDTIVTQMPPLSSEGRICMMVNDGHPDEFFLLENRQRQGWDRFIPGNGLLVTYVDYDEDVWKDNVANAVKDEDEYTVANDHERYTILHADNRMTFAWDLGSAGDCYPCASRDSLTDHSTPATWLYHPNSDGSHRLGKAVTGITRNDDHTVSFQFVGHASATGIAHPTADNANRRSAVVRDLQGRTVRYPKKGIYIINHHKIIIQ